MTVEGLMRKPKHSTESSIEEILASIRSIIAEDGAAPRPSGQTQQSEPVRRSTQNFENAPPVEQDADFVFERDNFPANYGQQATNTANTSDEILELTEDFMLAEASPEHSASATEGAVADLPPNDVYSQNISEEFGPAPVPEEELGEALSNLAAQVERLAVPDAEKKELSPTDFAAEQPVEDEANEGQVQLPEEDAKAFGAPEFAEPENQTVGQPQIAGIVEPKLAATPVTPPSPSSARQPVTPAARSKPVWSARRLETTEKPATSSASEKEMAANQERPAPPKPPATQSSSSVSRRDLWAEGVQMPVPDTGPEMPLPLSEDNSEIAAKQEDDTQKEQTPTEVERHAVGSFLTRVFGSAPAAEPEDEPTADENALRAQAEKLARDTISDFAEAKLKAPAVGNALKADKEFMNEVASSLANALALTNEEVDAELSTNVDLPQPASGEEPQSEIQPDTESISGLDVKVQEALAADTQASEVGAVKQKQDDEEALSVEAATEMVAEMTQDEVIEAAQVAQAENASLAAAESAQPASNEDEAAPPEMVETGQATQAEEGTAERPPETAESQESPADQVVNAASQSAPVLNLPPSLDASIKEMIKPLIIQWLNDNLPRIVEEAVREELADKAENEEVRKRSSA